MPERVVPIKDLPSEEQAKLDKSANWKIDGGRGDWEEIRDPYYGRIIHVAVVEEEGRVKFDKLNMQWVPAAYVIILRVNPGGKAEFLLPKEKRILLRDEQGRQGNSFIDEIPQGVIREWEGEVPADAAKREAREETGYSLSCLALIGRIALSPANSETIQPFYLARVPYTQRPEGQQLDDSEVIETERWFTWQQIQRLPLIGGSAIIGLALAQRVVKPDLL